jgi:hypothetical protein
MLNTPEAGPEVVGAKVIFTVQLEYTGNPEGQLLVWTNGPAAVIEIEFMSPKLVLVSVTAETALREPTAWGEKLREVGDRVMPGLSILSGI